MSKKPTFNLYRFSPRLTRRELSDLAEQFRLTGWHVWQAFHHDFAADENMVYEAGDMNKGVRVFLTKELANIFMVNWNAETWGRIVGPLSLEDSKGQEAHVLLQRFDEQRRKR